MDAAIAVRSATIDDIELVAPLFDAYRQFYGRAPALTLAREFIAQRLQRAESTVLIAQAGAAPVGFCQLYPTFSSAALARVYILNDLFVVPGHRRRGVGAALLRAAMELGRSQGVARLTLSTAVTNDAAQALYEACGWTRQTDYHVYTFRP